MAKASKNDFRKTLNFMLSIYYYKKGVVIIHKDVSEGKIPIDFEDLTAGFHTLLKDGYIEEVASGFSSLPVGAITGAGRVFFEEGGYQNTTTKFDAIVKWIKNNKLVAWVLVVFIALTAIIGVTVSIISIYKFFVN